MLSSNETQLDEFLAQYPEIELFEVILPDVNAGLRGKWISREKIRKILSGGIKLPLSSLVFDIWGRDPEALVFKTGDGDGLCRADLRTLAPVPWLDRPTGQLLVCLDELDGSSCGYDARSILTTLMARLKKLGLTPMLASEMEFYLFKADTDERGRPQHSQQSLDVQGGQTYGIELMQDMSEVMHAIRDACAVQNLPVDTLIKEAAPSQYEINLTHQPDALLAADHALMLQRVIKGVAKKHGLRASFMAKPFGDLAGNGMHMHCSMLDDEGNNAFDNQTDEGNDLLRHAIAGCLATMQDSMLLFAPHLNSYRRFQRGSHAPLSPTWGYENRTVAIRVPADSHQAMRLEHRVAGADANPYLVMSAILAGMLYGIENKLEAPAYTEGNAYNAAVDQPLPRYWADALGCFSQSDFIKDYLGEEFQEAFTLVKQQEMDEFDSQVTALEYQSNL
ncbi:MAG: glutamine synthetase [Oceanicoccus sp.]|jgi:glutamine synthetase